MPEDFDTVSVELTIQQASQLASLASYEARKRRKRAGRSGFTPEAGHLNLDLAKARVFEDAAERLRSKLVVDVE